uniref:IP17777p n=1 Tax=Drosophila melanogaster TaxID=7227 RepID=A2VEK3_DROME|nr:IP17777p [Drosophila melanogaster]
MREASPGPFRWFRSITTGWYLLWPADPVSSIRISRDPEKPVSSLVLTVAPRFRSALTIKRARIESTSSGNGQARLGDKPHWATTRSQWYAKWSR